MTVAFLSLGSNIEPEKNILEAVKLLSKHVRIVKSSMVYLTEPLLRKKQPKYYNCVIEIETDLRPERLKFDVLRVIEEELGRIRTEDKYAMRTIDIDLILFDSSCQSTEELTVPDPQIYRRAFLAIPLYELEPELVLPRTNRPIKEVASRFAKYKMSKLEGFTATLRSHIGSA